MLKSSSLIKISDASQALQTRLIHKSASVHQTNVSDDLGWMGGLVLTRGCCCLLWPPDSRCSIVFSQSLTTRTARGTTRTARATPAASPPPRGWRRKMLAVGQLMRQLPWMPPSGEPAPPIMGARLRSHSCQITLLEEVKKEFLEKIMVRTLGCH